MKIWVSNIYLQLPASGANHDGLINIAVKSAAKIIYGLTRVKRSCRTEWKRLSAWICNRMISYPAWIFETVCANEVRAHLSSSEFGVQVSFKFASRSEAECVVSQFEFWVHFECWVHLSSEFVLSSEYILTSELLFWLHRAFWVPFDFWVYFSSEFILSSECIGAQGWFCFESIVSTEYIWVLSTFVSLFHFEYWARLSSECWACCEFQLE